MGRDLGPSRGAQGLAISGETSVRDAIASVLVSRGKIFTVLRMESLIYTV